MGYTGKLELKEKAQKLRKQGLSYLEIRQQIPVSKDTLSRWCKDIPLTKEQQERLLQNKLYGQKKASLVAAENKREARIQRTQEIKAKARKDIKKLGMRDQFMLGIALYAAEGDKMDGKGGFTNADPQLISFMTQWLLSYPKISMNRLRGAIWLHEGLSEPRAKEYWSQLTGIPLEQFRKTYIAKDKRDSKKVRKNIHEYGVFAIRFSDSNAHRQIMGWISAVFGDRILTHSPVAQR